MKATLEIPDPVFKKAKAKAAEQGMPLRQFVTEAVEARLKQFTADRKPWMQVLGGLKHLKKENARIDKIIENEFEQIDPEDWN